jgi:hypothetical protein
MCLLLLCFSAPHRISSSVREFARLSGPQFVPREGCSMDVRSCWISPCPRCALLVAAGRLLTFQHNARRSRSGERIRSTPSLQPLAPRPTRRGCSGGRAPLSYRGMEKAVTISADRPRRKSDAGAVAGVRPRRKISPPSYSSNRSGSAWPPPSAFQTPRFLWPRTPRTRACCAC